MNKSVDVQTLHGTIIIPSSKSDGQRAILAAALAKDTSEIYNCGKSDDELAMLASIRKLGADVSEDESKITIRGIQNFPKRTELNVGESGLGLRLITAVCAAHRGEHTITGKGTLLKRPQGFFEHHFTQLGVQVNSKEGFLPIHLSGQLHGGELEVDGSLSSQFLSGLLMALPLLEVGTDLVVRNLKSIPYAQMTLDTLAEFGIKITHQNFEKFKIEGNQQYRGVKYAVESDWSSASYWLVAAALGHQIKCVGLSQNSHQADRYILDALVKANCVVMTDETGISVNGNGRRSFEFDATHCPDLFPALAVLAAKSQGVSQIRGLSRLKNKESDRGVAIQTEFEKVGVQVELVGDVMLVHGSSDLKSANVDSHHDHRMAMCLAILALGIEGGLTISNAECVSKSYPDFWNHLDSVIIR